MLSALCDVTGEINSCSKNLMFAHFEPLNELPKVTQCHTAVYRCLLALRLLPSACHLDAMAMAVVVGAVTFHALLEAQCHCVEMHS